jgi:Bacteriocin-protection, YdeI or OmpD-Associated/Domain of unknown function (DUF1905)
MKSTIRFTAKAMSTVPLPKGASATLPARGTKVEGMINGFPFRAALEPNGEGSHRLKMSKALYEAAGAGDKGTVALEITRVGEEPEVRVPQDLRKALAAEPRARATWEDLTPMTRREWILWLSSCKQEETRMRRIEKMCDMLAHGKRRVCCFGGLNWLTKDAKSVETWIALPTT